MTVRAGGKFFVFCQSVSVGVEGVVCLVGVSFGDEVVEQPLFVMDSYGRPVS